MKYTILILTFIALQSQASYLKARKIYSSDFSKDRELKIFKELFQSRYYHAAATYLSDYIEKGEQVPEELTEWVDTLVIKTGHEVFDSVSPKDLVRQNSWALKFVAANKLFKNRNYNGAILAIQGYPKEHKFASEAFLTLGLSYANMRNILKANKQLDLCSEVANTFAKEAKNERIKRYYTILSEKCIINKGRNYFLEKSYKKALAQYNLIPKTSYTWPYNLMEMAWSHFYLEDYNRVLGLLITYKSPLMTSYFFPEAEYLSAISYLKMCLYDDSSIVIDKYTNHYKTRTKQLKNLLTQHSKSETYFLKLALTDLKKSDKVHPFIRNLITQIRKRIRYSLDVINLKRSILELNVIKKNKNDRFQQELGQRVNSLINWKRRKLNHFVKREMFTFINQIHRFSYELFNVSLEVISNKKDLLYRGQKLSANRERGSLDNVKREELQHFWSFKGAFWADELGDYSFGLKSNCKVQKLEKNS